MRRLEYVCTACGRPFGRHESAKRHLLNPNIHDGKGRITSLTEYVLGIKQGRYLPPSYNNGPPRIFEWKKNQLPLPTTGAQRGGLQYTTKSRETFFDKMHQWANYACDLRDFTEIMTQQAAKAAEMSRLNPLPEFLFGYLCDKCYTTRSILVPSLDPAAMEPHQCNSDRVRDFESLKNKEEAFKNLRKNLVSSLKSRIDAWTRNSGKQLIAIPIAPESPLLQSGPPYLKKLKVSLRVGSNHYLNRAITSAKRGGMWIKLSDDETRNFLEMTYASVAIFEVRMMYRDDGSKNGKDSAMYEPFFVRIIPPQYVIAKKQNDDTAALMREFLKEEHEWLQEEEKASDYNIWNNDDDDDWVEFNYRCLEKRQSPNSHESS